MNPTREYENQDELDRDVAAAVERSSAAPTGAACFRTLNFASCSGGLTHAQAIKIAAEMGLAVSWYAGKTCGQISCRP